MEAFLHQVDEAVAHRLQQDLLQHLVAEGIGKHGHGCALADATGADVEEGLLVKLSHGAAMGAFHIVVVDF